MPKWKRMRVCGHVFSDDDYAALRNQKPVNTIALQYRLKALYKQECHVLLALRELQLYHCLDFNI